MYILCSPRVPNGLGPYVTKEDAAFERYSQSPRRCRALRTRYCCSATAVHTATAVPATTAPFRLADAWCMCVYKYTYT